MAISMVREPSETPNINNVDDFVGLRYAYGKNGCVKNYGNECSYTINGNIFHINSGRLVLQGVECDIDANGVDITIDSVNATRFYVIYLQVDLSTNNATIQSLYDTTIPTISNGDDLTQNPIGTANMELYRFYTGQGGISSVSKKFEIIKYLDDEINGIIDGKFDTTNSSTFGNFIVPKKRELWQGSTEILSGTGTEISFSDMPLILHGKIELELSFNSDLLVFSHSKVVTFRCYTGMRYVEPLDSRYSVIITFGTYSNNVNYIKLTKSTNETYPNSVYVRRICRIYD